MKFSSSKTIKDMSEEIRIHAFQSCHPKFNTCKFLTFLFLFKIITTSISKLKISGIFKKQNYESDMNNYWEKEERYWGKEICDFVPLITQHSQDPSLLSVI